MSKDDEIVMGTLVWDDRKGEGKIRFAKDYTSAAVVVSLDAAIDWQSDLAAEYKRQMARSRAEWDAAKARQRGDA